MQVNEFNQNASILALAQIQQSVQPRPQAGTNSEGVKPGEADSFTNSNVSIPMISGMYDMSGATMGGIPPVAASNEPFEAAMNPRGGSPMSGSSQVSEDGGAAGGEAGEEEGSKTKIVVEGGVTYLETTTTTNGVTTVTRTILSTTGKVGNVLAGFSGIKAEA